MQSYNFIVGRHGRAELTAV